MEDSSESGQKNFSFTTEVGIPDITDGLWRSHDAFTAVVRRIMKAKPENMAELLSKACDEHCEYNKKLLEKADPDNLEELGYDAPVAGLDEDDE